jgi:transcriptional regulator with XRE-family HTH domain
MKHKHAIKISTSHFCRAARALAGMTQKDLAGAASLSQQTIADFERGARRPHPNNLKAIFAAFEARGITFQRHGEKIVGITAPE